METVLENEYKTIRHVLRSDNIVIQGKHFGPTIWHLIDYNTERVWCLWWEQCVPYWAISTDGLSGVQTTIASPLLAHHQCITHVYRVFLYSVTDVEFLGGALNWWSFVGSGFQLAALLPNQITADVLARELWIIWAARWAIVGGGPERIMRGIIWQFAGQISSSPLINGSVLIWD